jgi:hypothetical protein
MTVLGYKKSSPLFVANGVAMAVTFFAVRIAAMPPYWLKVYSVYGTDDFNRLGYIQMVLVVTCFVLDVINLFWFYKIYQGAYRLLVMFIKPPVDFGGGVSTGGGGVMEKKEKGAVVQGQGGKYQGQGVTEQGQRVRPRNLLGGLEHETLIRNLSRSVHDDEKKED